MAIGECSDVVSTSPIAIMVIVSQRVLGEGDCCFANLNAVKGYPNRRNWWAVIELLMAIDTE